MKDYLFLIGVFFSLALFIFPDMPIEIGIVASGCVGWFAADLFGVTIRRK